MAFNVVGVPMYGVNEGCELSYPYPTLDTALIGAQLMFMQDCLFVEIKGDDGSTVLDETGLRAEIKARGLDR